ncbi:hypothetical protein [Sinorhizobium americanum]|uniref:Transmembrane protein n=1 Tax=Sinorhizobium americanum TaxID=194963 RepID=A0A4R2C131_9HYPH|nr:hypothetical protein [Sinorhizobium americanum]TCN34077.1 hypothetical protein EV184_102388 [Sinorhizobium americanum]
MAKHFDALTRLYDAVRDSNHDFKETTDIFPLVDTEKTAKTLDIVKKGAANGSENRPATAAKGHDEVEREIVDKMIDIRESCYKTVERQYATYASRLRGLDFEDCFSLIRQASSASLTEYRAGVAVSVDELFLKRQRLKDAGNDLADIKSEYGIKRAATLTTTAENFARSAVLTVLFLFEAIANGLFLSKSDAGGILGGVIVAVVFALINVVGTAIIAQYWVKQFNRGGFAWKVVGILGIVAYGALALLINVVLADYREVAASTFGEAGRLVYEKVMTSPFGFTDIETWGLFGVGIVFSLVAFIDVMSWGDPFPKYGRTYRRYVKAANAYVDQKMLEIDKLRAIRAEHDEKVNLVIRQLSKRRVDHGVILAARANLAADFVQFQSQLERTTNQLLNIYRDANRQARATGDPKYFSQAYALERRDPPAIAGEVWKESDLAESIREAQARLEQQMADIASEFDQAVAQYKNLETMFVEDGYGYTASKA